MQKNISIQLYSIREQLNKDFAGSLRKLAEIGYQWVESYGHFYGGLSAKEFSALLASLNMKISSSHANIELLRERLTEIIDYNLAIGSHHLVCAYAEYKSEKDVYDAIKFFKDASVKCRKAGILFSYHNHDHEFSKYSGRTILDTLLEETSPDEMGLELDVYWTAKAGIDPIVYLEKWKNRSTLLHCKDMDAGAERKFAAVGSGILNFPGIIQACPNVRYFVVEQDQSDNPFHCAEMSFSALRKLLQI